MVTFINNEIQRTLIRIATQNNNSIKPGDQVLQFGTKDINLYFI